MRSLTKSLERMRAGRVSCQVGRPGPPASLSSVVGRRSMLFSRDPELKRRIELAAKTQRRPNAAFPLLHDPIEDDEATTKVIKAAQEKADAEMDSKIRMGRCHGVWTRMKAILKEEHGVIWYSPREMNPGVKFD